MDWFKRFTVCVVTLAEGVYVTILLHGVFGVVGAVIALHNYNTISLE